MQHFWMLHDVVLVWPGSCTECWARACALVRFATHNTKQHVAIGWPNARIMPHTAILRYVPLKLGQTVENVEFFSLRIGNY